MSNDIAVVHGRAQATLNQSIAIQQASGHLVTQLCGLISDGTLSTGRGQALLSYLSDTPPSSLSNCSAPEEAADDSPHPGYDVIANSGARINNAVGEQQVALNGILDTTAPSSDNADVAKLLTWLNASIAMLDQLLAEDGELATTNQQNLATRDALNRNLPELTSAVEALLDARGELDPKMAALAKQQGVLSSAITDAISGAAELARGQAVQASAKNLDQLNSQLGSGLGILDTKFGLSTESLTRAATTIRTDAAAVVTAQKRAITAATDKSGVSISDQVGSNLNEIAASVTASTLNLAATSSLLSADLRTVLLDLGSQAPRAGMLGSIATSSATANAANSQLALASQTASSYSNARGQDIAGVQLRSAQTQAALQAQAALPLFHLDLPETVEHRTVYTFHIGAGE